MTDTPRATRPSLLDLWTQHHFDIPSLAESAGVEPITIQIMLSFRPVGKEVAEKVLFQLSALLHKDLSLSTVHVPLLGGSEVARLLERIDHEYLASKQGLQGLAEGTAKHQFITERMDHVGGYVVDTLRPILGEREAIRAYDTWFDIVTDEAQGEGAHA